MRAFLLTFRPFPAELELLDIFLNYFQDFICDYPHRWCVEKDDTPDAHYHAYIETQFRDKEKLFNNARYKKCTENIRKICSDPKYLTKWIQVKDGSETGGFNLKMVKDTPEDLKYSLGYVCKGDNVKRSGIHDISPQKWHEALEYYWTEERVKLLTATRHKNDVKILSNKTLVTHIQDFLDKKEIDITKTKDYDRIKVLMMREGYYFGNVSETQQQSAMRFIIIMRDTERKHPYIQRFEDIERGIIRSHSQTVCNQYYQEHACPNCS